MTRSTSDIIWNLWPIKENNLSSWSNIVYVHVHPDLDPIFQNSRKNQIINLSNWKLSSWIWHHQSNKISTALIEISTIKKIVAQWIDSPKFLMHSIQQKQVFSTNNILYSKLCCWSNFLLQASLVSLFFYYTFLYRALFLT